MPTRINLVDEATSVHSSGAVAGPLRRRSLLTGRSNSLKSARTREGHLLDNSVLVHAFTQPSIPIEITECIIEIYADAVLAFTRQGRVTSRTAFLQHIQNLSLVSRDVRYLALKQFFRTLGFNDAKEASGLLSFLSQVNSHYDERRLTGSYVWTRSLFSPNHLITQNSHIIKCLTRLTDLHIDFSSMNLASQRSSVDKLFLSLPSNNLLTGVLSLTMTNAPRIEERLLDKIATVFPGLTSLHLSSAEGLDTSCCPECYEESLSRIVHSPIQNVYPDSEKLAITFGSALAPLKMLKYLHIGMFLSRSTLLDWHRSHGEDHDTAETFQSIAECPRCSKYEAETKLRELSISMCISRHVRSLEVIEWASAYAMRPTEDGKDEHNFIEGPEDGDDDNTALSPSARSAKPWPVKSNLKRPDAQPYKYQLRVAGFAIDHTSGKIRITRIL